jgi:hypothetical protein
MITSHRVYNGVEITDRWYVEQYGRGYYLQKDTWELDIYFDTYPALIGYIQDHYTYIAANMCKLRN